MHDLTSPHYRTDLVDGVTVGSRTGVAADPCRRPVPGREGAGSKGKARLGLDRSEPDETFIGHGLHGIGGPGSRGVGGGVLSLWLPSTCLRARAQLLRLQPCLEIYDDEAQPAFEVVGRKINPFVAPAAVACRVLPMSEVANVLDPLFRRKLRLPRPFATTHEERRHPARTDRLDGAWHTYTRGWKGVSGLALVAVAAKGRMKRRVHSTTPGPHGRHRRYDDARRGLRHRAVERRPGPATATTGSVWSRIAWSDLPGHGRKPLAMDLPSLEGLFHRREQEPGQLWFPYTMRAVAPPRRPSGRRCTPTPIGDPLMSFSQKTYKWGKAATRILPRPQDVSQDWRVDRHSTHCGCTGSWAVCSPRCKGARTTARPDFPACGSRGGLS